MTTTTKLSDQLMGNIKARIQKRKASQYDWGDTELSSKQIKKILQSENGTTEVENEYAEKCLDARGQIEYDHLKEVVDYFLTEICDELNWDEDTVEDNDRSQIMEDNDLKSLLYSEGKEMDINFRQLLRNSSPKVVLQLKIHHDYLPADDIEYEQVKDILERLNINPRHIYKHFPNYRKHKGMPIVKSSDLRKLWNSAIYGGQYIVAVDLDLEHFVDNRAHYQYGIILHKGSQLRIHDYLNGTSSASVPLQEDLTITRSDLSYTFKEDREISYGLNCVFPRGGCFWDGTISPIIIQDAA
jgi:hypothetical protein